MSRPLAETIDSLNHPLAAELKAVLGPRGEDQSPARILIDDETNVIQAIAGGVGIEAVFQADQAALSDSFRAMLSPHTPIHTVARRTCKKLFETGPTSRIFAIARGPEPLRIDDLSRVCGDVVALEGLAISGNIGAIIRSAAAFSAGAVVWLDAPPAAVYDRRIIRASRGLVFALPVVTASTAELLHFCDRYDWPLVIASPRAQRPVEHLSTIGPRAVLAFGSERSGCSASLSSRATAHFVIRTNSRVESLNVSVAAGIALHWRRTLR